MEVSIQGRRVETLVKMVRPSELQLCPSLLLTIPNRAWPPSSFTIVNGPPLSPWERRANTWARWKYITLQGPAPVHTIKSSSTDSDALFPARHWLLSTMGTTVSCSWSVEIPSSPVLPQPERQCKLFQNERLRRLRRSTYRKHALSSQQDFHRWFLASRQGRRMTGRPGPLWNSHEEDTTRMPLNAKYQFALCLKLHIREARV